MQASKKKRKIFSLFTLVLLSALALSSLIPSALAEEEENANDPAFFQAFIIILREGIEAILIIAAIIAYLVVSKNQDKTKHVYLGMFLAILASILTAFMIGRFNLGEEHEELLEGLTLLTASVVLLYVTNWMLAKAHILKWQKYIKGKVEQALQKENSFALAAVAFLAVYREGFETVLFLQALSLQTGTPQDILLGIAVGGIILAGVFFAIMRLGLKIPINTFFLATSILLFFFALSFVGTGIHELQEAGTLPETSFALIPKIKDLGVYPTIETILGQIIVIAFGAFLAYIHIFRHHDFEPVASKTT